MVMSVVKVIYLFLRRSGLSTLYSWDSKTPAQPQISLITTVGLKSCFSSFLSQYIDPDDEPSIKDDSNEGGELKFKVSPKSYIIEWFVLHS